MKKIILAFDSFKGSADNREVAQAVEKAIYTEYPQCEIIQIPIADGGEGTTYTICSQLEVDWVECSTHNPLMEPITVKYAITKDGNTAILEMAMASGLTLIPSEMRNPMNTTTFGTGEMILDALNRGCRNFILGIGGSATTDAGIGLLNALGVKFLDKDKNELLPVGKNLILIDSIDTNNIHQALAHSNFSIACDVNNPFYGKEGAAYVYAPQKGASSIIVEVLDNGLKHYAKILNQSYNIDISNIPGAGAAGGMGGGLLPFLNAKLKSGIDTILDILHFDDTINDANLIFTGEGKLDTQTTMGKALGGILERAKSKSVPVIALAGSVEETKLLNNQGFIAALSIQPAPVSLEKAMQKEFTLNNITCTATQIIRIIKQFKNENKS